jgi:putative ABC transport system substrate-binding protein
MKRRKFLGVLGGAAAWPVVVRAQQTMPVIGFLDTRSLEAITDRLQGFRQGLKETGFVEGENVSILYRLAENQNDVLPGLAADLVRRNVSVIATAGDDVALVAAGTTKTIPIVFIASQDPVRLGLVTSLTRPGGNATGINFLTGELVAKRVELLRELVPKAARLAVLVNPSNPTSAEATTRDVETAARSMKLEVQVYNAKSRQEIDGLFSSFAASPPDALFVGTDTYFSGRRVQLVNLAA